MTTRLVLHAAAAADLEETYRRLRCVLARRFPYAIDFRIAEDAYTLEAALDRLVP